MGHYLEAHVTVCPKGSFFEKVAQVGRAYGFWASAISKDESGEEVPGDFILTTRDTNLDRLRARMQDLISRLKAEAYKPTRFKVEDCMVDSKEGDCL